MMPPVVRTYDFVMTHNLDADDFFIHRVQLHCAERGLNFFLVEPLWVQRFFDLYQRGEVWARVLLNMHSEHHLPDDIFHRLVKLAALRGTRVIDPPEVAISAFDKARLHHRLAAAGIPVPHTVIVSRAEVAGYQLPETDRALLGTPFVIKPALGYGKRGVVLDATSERDLARSVAAWEGEHYLLQRRVVPRELAGAPAYFRVYYAFSSVWCAWWNCYTDRYRLLLPEEKTAFQLAPLEEVVRQIAALTGMQFFSSEIAQTEDGAFVVIDYVNDQCHMLTQTANPKMGVPDELVVAIARRLVEGAAGLLRTPVVKV